MDRGRVCAPCPPVPPVPFCRRAFLGFRLRASFFLLVPKGTKSPPFCRRVPANPMACRVPPRQAGYFLLHQRKYPKSVSRGRTPWIPPAQLHCVLLFPASLTRGCAGSHDGLRPPASVCFGICTPRAAWPGEMGPPQKPSEAVFVGRGAAAEWMSFRHRRKRRIWSLRRRGRLEWRCTSACAPLEAQARRLEHPHQAPIGGAEVRQVWWHQGGARRGVRRVSILCAGH